MPEASRKHPDLPSDSLPLRERAGVRVFCIRLLLIPYHLSLFTFLLSLLTFLPACVETKTIYGAWGDLEAMSDQRKAEDVKAKRNSDQSGAGNFGIQLIAFEGEQHANRANLIAKRLKDESNLDTVWVQSSDARSAVMLGRYPSPDSFHAQEDLKTARMLNLDGVHLFGNANIIALTATGDTSLAGFELSNNPGDYTLQVGFYSPDRGGPEYQKTAERIVQTLRQQGYEAYFFHDPQIKRSHICVGVFYETDLLSYDDGSRGYTEKIYKLQDIFPYNLDNGDVVPDQMSGIVKVRR
jgi:hypothetical protein